MAWTTPRTWAAAEIVTAANMNAHVRDNLKAMSEWTAYTPTWTGTGGTPTVGNGTLAGRYLSYGEIVFVRISLTWGSTTAAAGITGWKFALPSSPSLAGGLPGVVIDSGTAVYSAMLTDFAAGAGVLRASAPLAPVSNTSPITWVNGDSLHVSGWYVA